MSNVFDEATQLSSGFALLPDLLFEDYLDTTCDWEALVDSFLEVPALIDEEKWREIGCKISSSLEELSLGLSFNITAILQFLGSLVQQILISGKHPRLAIMFKTGIFAKHQSREFKSYEFSRDFRKPDKIKVRQGCLLHAMTRGFMGELYFFFRC